ncbi:DUF5684 domain-containing protein [Cellulomonas denverensis]|uniref:DUF5684 domain-containing protein n=1 Tax=Cellulomonas denverensis TaxID=264297 RepID=UPI0035E8BDED
MITATLIGLLALLCLTGLHCWYAAALGAVFRRLGLPAWRAWVPVWNEVTLLERGGVPGWSVIYLFIPLVNLYGIVLHTTAAHRIGAELGRGTGTTVFGVIAPPVWAGVLGWSRAPDRGAGPVVQYRAVPVGQRAEVASSTAVPTAPSWTPTLDVAPATPPPMSPAPAPASPPPPRPVIVPALPAVPAPSCPDPDPDPDDADDEGTVLAVAPARDPWVLQLDDGRQFPVPPPTAVLGRQPSVGEFPTVQLADPGRTLSKTHARLDLIDGVWFITDLGSTNGVTVTEPDGAPRRLDPGTRAPVTGRILLGTLGALLLPPERTDA